MCPGHGEPPYELTQTLLIERRKKVSERN